jgi:SAM-dependent methyltransferase
MSISREQEFWDEHVPDLEHCRHVYNVGPSASTLMAIEAIMPVAGKGVLDFACGAGVLSAWMAARGAIVTGVDISPASIARAEELVTHLGLEATFTTASLSELPERTFDSVIGQYALHHVDLSQTGPMLQRVMKPDAVGAFVETMGLNPALNFARTRLSGHGPVARYGSDDERPLDRRDLEKLRQIFGTVQLETAQMALLRIFDRNVLKYEKQRVSRLLGRTDDVLLRCGFGRLSYHQVVMVRNTRG